MKLIIPSVLVGVALAQFDNDADSPISLEPRGRGGKRNKKTQETSEDDAVEAYVHYVMQNNHGSQMDELFAVAFRQRAKAEGLPSGLKKEIGNLIEHQNRAVGDRLDELDFNCQDEDCRIPTSLDGIWQYGCWCNFQRYLMTGQGPPVSPHDVACKSMNDCLKCAKRDAIEGGYFCDPKTTKYKAELAWATGIESIRVNCKKENPGDLCGAHVCTCELQLIDDILDLVWDSYTYEPEYLHSNGFDPEASCPAAEDIGDIDCCGKYPRRAPFRLGQKECCDSVEKIFNPFKEQCCDTGIYDIGEMMC